MTALAERGNATQDCQPAKLPCTPFQRASFRTQGSETLWRRTPNDLRARHPVARVPDRPAVACSRCRPCSHVVSPSSHRECERPHPKPRSRKSKQSREVRTGTCLRGSVKSDCRKFASLLRARVDCQSAHRRSLPGATVCWDRVYCWSTGSRRLTARSCDDSQSITAIAASRRSAGGVGNLVSFGRVSIPVRTFDTCHATRGAEIDVLVAAGDAKNVSRRQLIFHLSPLLGTGLKDKGAVQCSDKEPRAIAPHRIRIYYQTSDLCRKTAQLSTAVQLEQSAAVRANEDA